MAPVATLTSLVLLVIILTFFLSLLSPAASLAPGAPPHDESDNDFQTLLCLKLHLSNTNEALASWRNDSLQFCSWPGVTCSKRYTSRVTALNLESLGLDGQIPSCIGNLTFLKSIHLPYNQLNGHIPPELGDLNRLSYLNLSSNKLTSVIPDSISSCSRLQIIDLGSNFLNGMIPASLIKCSSLQEVYFNQNALEGSIPEGLGMLSNLSILFLATNNLAGNIPLSLGRSSSLTYVVLTNNSLTGGVPPLLANSSSLQWLDLTNNHLSGEIPPALFNSSSLQFLYLGINNFVGSIPPLSHISSPLEYLVLSQNNLSGSIPSSIGDFSQLLFLQLAQNNFQGSIPLSLGKLANLLVLDLTYNNLSGTVPASIYSMSTLIYLGMGANHLVGEIPDNVGHTLPSIQTLILQQNHFKGQIPTSLATANNFQVINLRDNAFHGIIPSFGSLPQLIELDLGMNQLEAGDWSFLSSLTNCTQLVRLYLDKNILQGSLPHSIAGLSKSLEVLLLSANQISGTIPPEIEHLTNLTLLHMEQNLFTGNIPDTLGNLTNLFVLSLSQNKLSGQIPLSIGKLSKLSELYLQENNLSASIPGDLGRCKNLDTLNLSCNSFDGSIPKELFTLSSLSEGLDLSHNQLSGPIPLEIGGLMNLGPLNISNNHLSGQIPSTLGACVHLESVHMEGNLLEGRIPDSLRTLRGIIEMDLSRNNLTGEIPEFFESFSSLNLLNLSFNNLEGPVPTGGIFQNTSKVFIQGNKKLCASSPQLQLPLCLTPTSKKSRRTSYIVKIVGFTILALVSLSCLAAIGLMKRKKAKQPPFHPSCNELKKLSYADLVKATAGFSSANLVGSGKYGLVYKGRFESEAHAVAIKVFKLDQFGATKNFITECEALKNTRHRNLVRVITACSAFDPTGHEFKALVLEYMVNGSLESWLHPTSCKHGAKGSLSLISRIIIAVDIASALDYLHNSCTPPMVHCDLKPGNILLDDDMHAHVGDFGLAKFLRSYSFSSTNSSTSLMEPRGSIGYIAPEYGIGSKISKEGDVYSYGIILLEILTRKHPANKMFKDDLNLHKFVEKVFPQEIGKVLDPNIIPQYEGEDANSNVDHEENRAMVGILSCIMQMVKLGLSCSVDIAKDRPTMREVYAEITEIKEAFAALHQN